MTDNLRVRAAQDGTWVEFKAASGRSALLRIETIAEKSHSLIGVALRDWCQDRQLERLAGAKADFVAVDNPHRIVAVNQSGDHRTGKLSSTLTPADIAKVLGFHPNIDDDESKVKYSWGFTVDGKRAGIWDYKGSRWSVFDPDGVLPSLFPGQIEK